MKEADEFVTRVDSLVPLRTMICVTPDPDPQRNATISGKNIGRFGSLIEVYLTIIPRARVGYEMIDSQRGA